MAPAPRMTALAGADVSLPQALRWMIAEAGLAPAAALAMMTRHPARLLALDARLGDEKARCHRHDQRRDL